jgi:hypothetical protein
MGLLSAKTDSATVEQVIFTPADAARRLGVSSKTLQRWARKYPSLYEPATTTHYGQGLVYHIEQLLLIEGVVFGNVDLEDAAEIWTAKRRLIGLPQRHAPAPVRRSSRMSA